MRLPPGIRRLLHLVALRGHPDEEVDEEIAFHFAETVRALQAEGMDEPSARREARRRFGNVAAYRRALRDIDGGPIQRKGGDVMDVILGNLRFAVRSMKRAPGFAAAVVVILALGIGANAVMFGVVDRLLLSPPQHVAEPDDVRHVYLQREIFNGTRPVGRTLTWPDYEDLQAVDAFSRVAAYTSPQATTLGRGDAAQRVQTVAASWSLFPLLGVTPRTGRFYYEAEDALGADPVAVLSEEFWIRNFGADPDVIGRRIDLGEGSYEVVGVAPAGFTGAELAPVDIWLPIARSQELESGGTGWYDGEHNRNWWWLRVAVRLDEGTDASVAADQATAAHRAGRDALIREDRYDEGATLTLASVIAARGPDPSAEAQVARWLAGVSLIVLLIACFNVANLLLARAARWRREVAVRMALGISRGRLLGQLLTESLVLAGLGAAAALLLARWGGSAIHSILLPNVAFTDAGLSGRLVVFLAAAAVLTAGLAGLLPALQASRSEVADALRAGGRGVSRGSGRTRTLLLVAQAALSVVLLIGAGLFVTSLRNARTADLGFDPEQVVVVRLEWSESLDTETRHQEFQDLRTRVERLPGVESAALTYSIPFYSSIGVGTPRVPGRDSIPSHPSGGPYANKVDAAYFRTMDLQILQGRGFEAADEAAGAPPVMILTESLAEAVWPDGGAVGQCMVFGDDDDASCTTVVGVVENFHRQDLVEPDPHFQFFFNFPHPSFRGPAQAMMVRTVGPPAEGLEAIRREISSASALVRFPVVQPMTDNIEPQMRSWLLGASMFTVFGVLALIVAALGLYSVLAFDVATRRVELGIRSALGAGSRRLVGMVARRAVLLVGVGVTLGVGAALAGASHVAPLLHETSPRSPVVYLGVVAVLFAVAVVAGLVPAWRVTRVDPREALQAE
ncbi:MAG: ADOP family duplicated permease [Longimicrobiales bacterium]